MALDGIVQNAKVGALGFDSNTVISSAVARQFVTKGFTFCVRYVSRGPEPEKDLSPAEAERILNAGLALMPVQHVRKPGWLPSAELGTKDGQYAASNTRDVGFPKGVNVWCDLEGIAPGTPADIVAAYCNAWFDAVTAAGYVPGIYVGSQCILNEQQLYQLKFQHYWRSQSNVPNSGKRGYQMIQLFPPVRINGVDVDIDVTQEDYKGDGTQWFVRATERVVRNLEANARPKEKTAASRRRKPQHGRRNLQIHA
ncbi:MAG TPA: DUF1906 domain-containing protein [Terriglobia bacterium]|nr:DUF1906 domain-containing protein [Terriglobia bacterium]